MAARELVATTRTDVVPRRRGSLVRREIFWGYFFISPWIIGLLAFTAGPLLASIYFGFTDYPILSGPTWVGIENYEKIFGSDRQFGASLWNTAYFVLIRVPLHLSLALALALLLNRAVRGLGFFRTAIYLPSMIPIVALAVVWRVLLDPRTGYVNYFLSFANVAPINWLTSQEWAKPVIIFVSLFHVGVAMIIFLAGLGSVPEHLYEAAAIDGANPFQRFFSITLPMITPVILYNLVIDVINSFQVFAYAFVMTKGGPADASLFYVLYIQRQAFEFFRMGYASALSTILFLIILVFTALLMRFSKHWVQYDRI